MSATISIVTPSYNMIDYLKRCHASVLDQAPDGIEHIVVDGFSQDGTADWLKQQDEIRSIIERDGGMYEALNKGLMLTEGSIIGHLNCDEQYLPGILSVVRRFFDSHPNIDVVYGDSLFVDEGGNLLAFKKSYPLRAAYIRTSSLYVATCTMFYRRHIFDRGYRYKPALRSVSDGDFIIRLLQAGFKFAHIRTYFAAFTVRTDNLSWSESGVSELKNYRKQEPAMLRMFRIPLQLAKTVERVMSGAIFEVMPIVYSIYASSDTSSRKRFECHSASFTIHPDRWAARFGYPVVKAIGVLLRPRRPKIPRI